MPLNFAYGSIADEALAKLESLVGPTDPDREAFLDACSARFARDELARIGETLDFLEGLESKDDRHPSMRAYLNHPVRVALRVLRSLPEPRLEPVQAALLHNVYEIGGLNEHALLGQGFGSFVADGVRLLTIDRRLQNDAQYLNSFYEAIEGFGPELVLIRCVDKIDNLLAMDAIEATPVRTLYLLITQRYVAPMATHLDQRLSDYMGDLIAHMAEYGPRAEWVARYDAFKTRAYAV